MFSGTLGYIFSSFENGDKTFSEVIREAYRLGYTEPHPYDDLNGLDVARKLLILARYLGNEAQLSDISLQPLVPEDLYDGDVETFLNNCASLDEKYEEHKNRAAASGETLRYVDEYDRETGLTV